MKSFNQVPFDVMRGHALDSECGQLLSKACGADLLLTQALV